MITNEKFAQNLEYLKKSLPKKPFKYTTDHPISIKEALTKYSNQRSVNLMQANKINYDDNNYPLILWMNPVDSKFGFMYILLYKRFFNRRFKTMARINKKKNFRKFKGLKDFEYLSVPIMLWINYKVNVSDTISNAFDVNKRKIKQKLKSYSLLNTKGDLIEEIFKSYNRKYWYACINTILPLLDFVTRKLFNTQNLTIDIGKICKLFQQNGFSIDRTNDFMPHLAMVMSSDPAKKLSKEEKDEIYERVKDNMFGIIGVALSSFLHFAYRYYAYYKEDTGDSSSINRHAILHGSIDSYGNKANAIRLITFLFLTLELEPVFEILLKQ